MCWLLSLAMAAFGGDVSTKDKHELESYPVRLDNRNLDLKPMQQLPNVLEVQSLL
jgi:hypothetical protein